MIRKYLVTGGAGFVGRHVCKRLVDSGAHVVCVDNLVSESALHPNDWPKHLKVNERRFRFVKNDARVFFAKKACKYDMVVHLAAIVGGRVMIENSPLAVATDLSIDAEMFNWISKSPPGKLVYFSSSAAYPIKFQRDDCFKQTLNENLIKFDDDIGMADMTYGLSKLVGEILARTAHEKYNVNVTCFRPFSGYGEDQHKAYPFPAILNRIMAKECPINVWSDTVRDFIYIEDCIDGMMKIIEKIDDGSGVNLGTGVGTSFSTLASKMAYIVGHNMHVNILNDKPAGVYYRVADTSHAKQLGFTAKTTLEEGIKRCIELF